MEQIKLFLALPVGFSHGLGNHGCNLQMNVLMEMEIAFKVEPFHFNGWETLWTIWFSKLIILHTP